jgi:putative aminopeptidase FrvX
MKTLIQKLVETPGPSGYESQIRQIIQEKIEAHVDDLKIDALGNLIAKKGELSKEGKKIMLVAHMDEIGIITTHIHKNGYIRFTTIGGVRPVNCVGGRVRFLDGQLGVIGIENTANNNKAPAIDELFIDCGASSRQDCPVDVGEVAAFDRTFIELKERLVSKAMDDRIGVAVLIETIQQLSKTPHQAYFVFSVQEEVGTRGAITAAFGVDPDLGLAVDVTGTGDTPMGEKMEVSLGKGPAIKIRDNSMLADPRVVDWMVRSAEKANIPYQREVLLRGGTDARAIQLTRSGVPAGCLSIPCRYVHSPSEMVDYQDVKNGVKLLVELLQNPVGLVN